MTRSTCIHFHLTGVCSGCDREHSTPANSSIVCFPDFYGKINRANGSVIDIPTFFQKIYPAFKGHGPIIRMGISTNKLPHLEGVLYIEFSDPAKALSIKEKFLTVADFSTNILAALLPREESLFEFIGTCGNNQHSVLNSNAFTFGTCNTSSCDGSICTLLHLVKATPSQIIYYEKKQRELEGTYTEHAAKELLELSKTMENAELEEVNKREEVERNLEGRRMSLEWSWANRHMLDLP